MADLPPKYEKDIFQTLENLCRDLWASTESSLF